MDKELKDYAPFYIGCDVLQDDNEIARLVGIYAETCMLIHEATGQFGECDISKIKLILRPLPDIKHEEFIELYEILNAEEDNSITDHEQCKRNYAVINISGPEFKPSVFRFLLSKHFNLFHLIEAGLAIDATTLKQKS